MSVKSIQSLNKNKRKNKVGQIKSKKKNKLVQIIQKK